jgi:hypothetical protein
MFVTSSHQQAVGAASAPVCRVHTECRQLGTGQAILRLTNERHDCTPQHLRETAAAAWTAVLPGLPRIGGVRAQQDGLVSTITSRSLPSPDPPAR